MVLEWRIAWGLVVLSRAFLFGFFRGGGGGLYEAHLTTGLHCVSTSYKEVCVSF